MSFESLQERLTALQETTSQLKEFIDRLAGLTFQPGSVPLHASISSLTSSDNNTDNDLSGNAAVELSSEINQILRDEEEELELLQEEITDLRSGRPGSDAQHQKLRLKDAVQRLSSELKTCRTRFRKAQLAARRNMEAAQKLERSILLSSYTARSSGTSTPSDTPNNPANPNNTKPRQQAQLFAARDKRRLKQKGGGDRDIVDASSDLTAALRRTHAMIAGEVAKSSFATQTLAESTAALKELQQNYEGLDGMLKRSRDLLGTLLTSQKSDTWYLQTALYMLLGTLAWLVFRRFFYGPLWWLLWLPLRTVFRTGKAVSHMGQGTTTAGEGGARMPVVGTAGQSKVVGVGEEGSVPTIQVGHRQEHAEEQQQEDAEDESLVEKVGRIVEGIPPQEGEQIDEEQTGAEVNGSEEEQVQRNPKKRMWEEEVEEQRVRDEL
ncbi:hypothetical protein QBC46DRAFT_27212 [Diplogelasinospora grovesii]|uniref:Sec20 C-terminal domain-containing protein n=1 Tax=Diplogelasinospora grovesii TaxID=303347 RepID=A0AAN6ND81_9PEZI|nr:hypothetical protein QBC46DRAFT_27212 [Diplogelasinospora grovesii]